MGAAFAGDEYPVHWGRLGLDAGDTGSVPANLAWSAPARYRLGTRDTEALARDMWRARRERLCRRLVGHTDTRRGSSNS